MMLLAPLPQCTAATYRCISRGGGFLGLRRRTSVRLKQGLGPGREARERRRPENIGNRQFRQCQSVAYRAVRFDRQQGVPAKIEKVVVRADAVDVEDLAPDIGDPFQLHEPRGRLARLPRD